jgi:hypothetical protein
LATEVLKPRNNQENDTEANRGGFDHYLSVVAEGESAYDSLAFSRQAKTV